jgi:hypothetical protein
MGTSAKMGIDPQNFSANISYTDGLNLVDVSRENASWEITVDSTTGMTYDKASGSLKGVKTIKRTLGPQITGYLKELAEKDPESARKYMEAMAKYWELRVLEAKKDAGK